MKYSREWKDGSGVEELTRNGAEKIIKKWYPGLNKDALEEMLTKPGSWNCMFSYVNIEED